MEKQYRVETHIGGDLAELYEAVLSEFEQASGMSLSELNRSLLQTGMLFHLTMMTSMGVVSDEARRAHLDGLAEKVGGDNLLWEIVELARRHWRDGASGAIDLKA